MSMRTTDRIVAPSRGEWGATAAYAANHDAARLSDCDDYTRAVFDLCKPDDMPDFSIVIAQSVHETSDPGPWQSHWWVTRLNPAGLGITGDPQQNAASPLFRTGDEAARAQVSHLLCYALGPADAGSLWFRKTGRSIVADDPRYDAYLEAYGNTVQAETINDLGGTWATDTGYGPKVVARGNAIYPALPDQEGSPMPDDVAFGRVSHPPMEIRDIPTPPQTAWDDLGPRTIRAICWHRSQGTHRGNDVYFRGEGADRALTDYGIGVLAVDGAALAGSLYRWNDPRGRRSPYANGKVSKPYGDGIAFVNRYGINAVNRDVTSVEISGFYPVPGEETRNTPLDDRSRETLAHLTAYWADQYRIRWDTFPHIPGEGNRSFVIWHQEFTIGTGKTCPGPIVMDQTHAIIERAKAIMQAAQTATPSTTTTAPPMPTTTTTLPPELPPLVPRVPIVEPADAPNRTFYFDGRLMQRVSPARLTLVRNAVVYAKPDGKSLAAREPLPKGTAVSVPYVVDGDDGGMYRASKGGLYIRAGQFTERKP